MKSLKNIFLSCLFSLLFANTTWATKPISVATMAIPLMVVSPTEGKFVEMTQEIGKRVNQEFNVQLFPPNRARAFLQQHKVDCFFPALESTMKGIDYVKSENFYLKHSFIFHLKNGKELSTLDSLKGKVVGLTKGYTYPKAILENDDLHIEYATNDEMNIRKLIAKRIDAFIVEGRSGRKATANEKAEDLVTYNPEKAVFSPGVFYACTNTSEGKQYAEFISTGIAKIIEDGTYLRLFGKPKP